jgi:hypothetical protein
MGKGFVCSLAGAGSGLCSVVIQSVCPSVASSIEPCLPVMRVVWVFKSAWSDSSSCEGHAPASHEIRMSCGLRCSSKYVFFAGWYPLAASRMASTPVLRWLLSRSGISRGESPIGHRNRARPYSSSNVTPCDPRASTSIVAPSARSSRTPTSASRTGTPASCSWSSTVP